ncbi:hypothetical protein RNZ50_17855 [Paracoccaceae bacterium Fryx2]|nr:hypothetical protein [Paracoccaceae bacterium Fryx2]
MRPDVLKIVILALVVLAGVLAYYLYQERQQPTGVEIKIDEGGISIQEN